MPDRYSLRVRSLTKDLTRDDLVPYFFWDEDISVGELKATLQRGPSFERDRLLGKMLREANDRDVWRFVKPVEVAAELERLERRIGRRYGFWKYLIDGWRRDGLL